MSRIRIRSVKPEVHTVQTIASLPDDAFRTFIGLYSLVDDEGRCNADPAFIFGRVFWAAPRPIEQIAKALGLLAARDLITPYTFNGFPYLQINGWRDSRSPTGQAIDKPKPSSLPGPEHDGAAPYEPTAAPPHTARAPREPTKLDADAAEIANAAVAKINALAGTSYLADSEGTLKLCRALAKAGHTVDEANRVIESQRAWLRDDKMREYFRPATLLALSKFETYLEQLEAVRKPALRVVDNGPEQLMLNGEVIEIPGAS